jgi:hypothetical protein
MRLTKKQIDARVNDAYRAACPVIQVPMMKLSEVFNTGRASVMAGDSAEETERKLRAFVETIRTD